MDDMEFLVSSVKSLLRLSRIDFYFGLSNFFVNLITVVSILFFLYRAGQMWERERQFREDQKRAREQDQDRYRKHVEITEHYMNIQKQLLTLFAHMGKEASQTVDRVETRVNEAVNQIKRHASDVTDAQSR